jgi:hypothetical protein
MALPEAARRRGAARAPEANGRAEVDPAAARPRRNVGELARRGGRVVLWLAVALVLIRGLSSILSPAPEAPARAAAAPSGGAVDQEVGAYAETFVKRWLSYDVAHPEYREIALARYLAEDLDAAGGVEVPESGPNQAVEETSVARVRPNGPGRSLVTVAATVASRRLSTRYVTVPVQQGAGGALVIYDLPSFEAPPARAEAPEIDTNGLAAEERDAIEDLVGRFFAAYLSGREGALAYFLPPGTALEATSERYTVTELSSVKQVGRSEGPQRTVIAVVEAKDRETGAVYLLRYQALLVYRGNRWLVARVNSL